MLAAAAIGASSGVMLFDIAADQVNLVLTCICQAAMGGAIMLSILANLKHMGDSMIQKNLAEKNAFLSFTIIISGLTASILCLVSDILYYMNRNELIWVTLMSSAFPIGFLLANALLHFCTARIFSVSSTSRNSAESLSGVALIKE